MSELPITNATVDFVGKRTQGNRELDVWARDVDVMIAPIPVPQILMGALRYQYTIHWGDDAELSDGTMPQPGDEIIREDDPINDRIALRDITQLDGAFGERYWRAFILPVEGQ